MNSSEKTISPTKYPPGYVPELQSNPTIEELDDWIIALGGRELSDEEMREIVRTTIWPDIPGENPGDPGFPFAKYL